MLIGHLGSDPKKKTVCIYGHLDVQPALKEDGWNTEPFTLVEVDSKLYGRGATDDKGPVLAWVNCLQGYIKTSTPLPVNLKFIFEAMEEAGSVGLHQLVRSLKNTFLKNVDYFCISDSYWLGNTRPCVTYGLRGNAYFYVEIEGAKKDLHSGVYGGAVHEALVDLVHLFSKLTDENGHILIPGVMDHVKPFNTEERRMLESLDFCPNAYKEEVGTSKLRFGDKVNLLAHRWRFPALSIHGIQGAFSGPGAKTVIPQKVVGKFSIRLVPDQEPEDITQKVIKYLNDEFKKLNSPNKLLVTKQKGSLPWVGETNDNNFTAAKLAIKHGLLIAINCSHCPNSHCSLVSVYGIEPDMIREGGSIPVTLTFQEVTGKSVLLLPIGAADDGAHSQNEKIDKRHYINGSKVFAAYLYFISAL